MTDQGGGFNWNLGGPPKKPDDKTTPEQPPVTKYPAPPAAAPPAAGPPAAAWPPAGQPTEAYTWGQPTQAYTPPSVSPASDPANQPTQAFSWDQPTEAYNLAQPPLAPPQAPPTRAFDPSLSGPTELLGAAPIGLPELRDEGLRSTQQGSAIDSLFGESQFQEYEASAFPAEGFSALATGRPREPREPISQTQKILFWVAGGLVAAILLTAVFFLGRSLPGLIPQPEAEAPAPLATTAPVAAAPVVGPVAPGEYDWDQLLGTECLEPFGTAWDESYTVVDCTTPHAAQLAYRGVFADEAFAPYPGVDALQARINLLCTSPTSVNYGAAGSLSDITVSASYAATEDEWNAGDRQYYCFLTRSTGEPFTVSLANAPVADAAPVPSIPSNDP